jgi:hypothetical protein
MDSKVSKLSKVLKVFGILIFRKNGIRKGVYILQGESEEDKRTGSNWTPTVHGLYLSIHRIESIHICDIRID